MTPVMHGAAVSNENRRDTVNTGRCTYTGDLYISAASGE